jgi:ferredoxin
VFGTGHQRRGIYVYVIRADFDACEGFGNCAMNAPQLFGLDDDDRVLLLGEEVAEDAKAYAEEAIRSCPVNVLSLEAV